MSFVKKVNIEPTAATKPKVHNFETAEAGQMKVRKQEKLLWEEMIANCLDGEPSRVIGKLPSPL